MDALRAKFTSGDSDWYRLKIAIFRNFREFAIPDLFPNAHTAILIGAAEGGHIDLCEMIHDRTASDQRFVLNQHDFDEMLICGAFGNHPEICALAHKWGANNFREALSGAINRGNVELCLTIRTWGIMCEYQWRQADWESMLSSATTCGNKDLCELARHFGAIRFEQAAQNADRYKYPEIAKMIRSWIK